MTPDSPPARRAYRRLRVPAFYPVPTRTRRDGWTVERQADPSTGLRTGFLGMLAELGSVIGACEAGVIRQDEPHLGCVGKLFLRGAVSEAQLVGLPSVENAAKVLSSRPLSGTYGEYTGVQHDHDEDRGNQHRLWGVWLGRSEVRPELWE